MTEGDLLARIARTLKQDVGPSVIDEYPKTQAYMAAVVLQKLAVQLQHAAADADAGRREMSAMIDALQGEAQRVTLPTATNAALATLASARDDAAVSGFIESLYAERLALGEDRFASLLGRVRQYLRASLDRRMEFAA